MDELEDDPASFWGQKDLFSARVLMPFLEECRKKIGLFWQKSHQPWWLDMQWAKRDENIRLAYRNPGI